MKGAINADTIEDWKDQLRDLGERAEELTPEEISTVMIINLFGIAISLLEKLNNIEDNLIDIESNTDRL